MLLIFFILLQAERKQNIVNFGQVCVMKTAKITPQYLRAAIQQNSYNEEDNTVEVAFATETPVKRYDWNEGRYFFEVLEISKKAVDLTRLLSGAPVLNSHNSYSLDSIIGVVENAWIDEAKSEGRATLRLSEEKDDEEIVSKVKKGIIRNLSVGYKVAEYTVTENEKEFPEYRATKWTPMEISFVAIPADHNAGVRNENDNNFNLVNIKMDENTNTAPDTGVPPAAPQPPQPQVNEAEIRQQAVEQERQRVADITSTCTLAGLDAAFSERLISEGTTIDEARAQIIDEVAKRANKAPTVQVTGDDEKTKERNAMIDGILHRANPGSIDIMGNEKAQKYGNMRLLDLAKDRLRTAGENFSLMSEQEIVKRAWATTDYPTLLTATFDRTLRRFYEGTVDEWKFIARQENATDFRTKTGIKVDGTVTFDEIPEGGEYKESPILQDESATIKLKKFGRKYSITDIAIINDDLSVFSRLPQIMAIGAQQFQSDLVWDNIISNKKAPDGKALFHADHKNLGTAAAISEASLTAARVAMRRQTSPAGHKLGLRPHILLVPPELQTAAEKMVTSILASATSDVNIFANTLKVVVSDQLEDPKAWYILADPANISVDGIVYAYLNGQPGLRTESRVNWDTDALEVKGSMAFATAVWGWQGMYKNPGQ